MPRWMRALGQAARAPEVVRCVRRCRRPGAVVRRYLSGGDLDAPFRLELRTGARLDLRTRHDLVTAWVVFLRDEYRVPADARTVLDVGANIGCFSVRAAFARPGVRVVAAEPFPDTFANLAHHVALNGLSDRVTCWPVGVGATSGARLMGDDGPSQSRGVFAPGTAAAGRPVDVVSFDELTARACRELGTDTIDFAKIDIEGGEHEALLAAPAEALRRVERIGMEYHPNRPKVPLFAHLVAAGFRLDDDQRHGPDVGVAHFGRG